MSDPHPHPSRTEGPAPLPLSIGPGLALWRSQHRLDAHMERTVLDGIEPVEIRHSTVRLLARMLALHSTAAHRAEQDPAVRLTRYELPLQARLEAAVTGSRARRDAQREFVTAMVGMVGRDPHERAVEVDPGLWDLIAATDRRLVSIIALTRLVDVVARELDEEFSIPYHELVNQLETSLLTPTEGRS